MIDFEEILRNSMAKLFDVAENRTRQHATEFGANWRNRFGKEELIGDESGEPGTAEPLAGYTIAMRIERGNHSDAMLYDPSHDHVKTEGTIRDSIQVENDHEYEIANTPTDGTLVTAMKATTNHSKFPLNEYGWGVSSWGTQIPTRTTLLPTNLELGVEFKGLMKSDIEAASGKKWTKR